MLERRWRGSKLTVDPSREELGEGRGKDNDADGRFFGELVKNFTHLRPEPMKSNPLIMRRSVVARHESHSRLMESVDRVAKDEGSG